MPYNKYEISSKITLEQPEPGDAWLWTNAIEVKDVKDNQIRDYYNIGTMDLLGRRYDTALHQALTDLYKGVTGIIHKLREERRDNAIKD